MGHQPSFFVEKSQFVVRAGHDTDLLAYRFRSQLFGPPRRRFNRLCACREMPAGVPFLHLGRAGWVGHVASGRGAPSRRLHRPKEDCRSQIGFFGEW